MLILDELNFTKEIIKNKNYGTNYVKLKTLVLLAKYYYWEEKDTREVKRLLRDICRRVDKNWNETVQGWKISVSVKEAKKRRIRMAIAIPITQLELEKIKEVNNYSLEKILFSFLVYSKVLKYNNTLIKPRKQPRLLGLFYVNESLSNMFSVAKVDVRKKQRTDMIHRLYTLGYLDATKYGGFLLKYVFEDSPVAFEVVDYENLVLHYQKWNGEQVSTCSCGGLFLKRNPNEQFCNKCKKERRLEQWRQQKNRK